MHLVLRRCARWGAPLASRTETSPGSASWAAGIASAVAGRLTPFDRVAVSLQPVQPPEVSQLRLLECRWRAVWRTATARRWGRQRARRHSPQETSHPYPPPACRRPRGRSCSHEGAAVGRSPSHLRLLPEHGSTGAAISRGLGAWFASKMVCTTISITPGTYAVYSLCLGEAEASYTFCWQPNRFSFCGARAHAE